MPRLCYFDPQGCGPLQAINAVLAVELFLIFRAWWVLLIALAVHGVGMLASLNEPRIFDLWITRVRNCPRIKNYHLWRCNSYRP
ncbi:VirB3 family type IV secretion system protein [Erythrobacteraceae bacterium E2-1 Yellow Sea]|nr:VirB3 family type IV secretion system protein [Erythrobacteraceae bacterium E2-1 Yellow Sea]